MDGKKRRHATEDGEVSLNDEYRNGGDMTETDDRGHDCCSRFAYHRSSYDHFKSDYEVGMGIDTEDDSSGRPDCETLRKCERIGFKSRLEEYQATLSGERV